MNLEYTRGQIDTDPGWAWFRDTYVRRLDSQKYNVTLYTCNPVDWLLHDAPYNPTMFHHEGFVLASCQLVHKAKISIEYALVIVSNAERLLLAQAEVQPGARTQVQYGVCYTLAAVKSFPPFNTLLRERLGL